MNFHISDFLLGSEMITIREFRVEDYDTVFALWQNSGPGVGISRSDTREEIAKKLQRDPDLFLVAVDGDKIIGTVIGGYDGRRGIIYHLAVDQAYRGNGIGKLLMAEVEKRLAAKGCLKAYLLVTRENLDVIEFYRALDWETMDVTLMGKSFDLAKKESC
jgi:ribosomal protein S18 acetylase RimI-like enzyme